MYKELKEKYDFRDATREFMGSVRAFLEAKTGGNIPSEWEGELKMLEDYYWEYLKMTKEISKLKSFTTTDTKGRITINPLFRMRDNCASKIQGFCQDFGLNLKSSKKLEIFVPETTKSALDAFLTGSNKKSVETR